jgi:8-oxo-dGTP diphosphatase
LAKSTEPFRLLVAVDLVILTVREDSLQLLVIERAIDPYQGRMALPGGFLKRGESPDDAALRELRSETGLDGTGLHLEQLATYGDPGRDPRGQVVTVAYLAVAPDLPIPEPGSDARAARWEPVEAVAGRLAFDHDTIVADAVERARGKLEYTTLATVFCGPTFTIGELRRVYEVVWDMPLDPRNFSRKVVSTEGFVEATGEKRSQDAGRPAALYRHGGAARLHPPMMRGTEEG